MLRYILQHLLFMGTMFAAAAPPLSGAGNGSGGTGSTGSTGTNSGGTSGSGGAAGTGQPTGDGSQQSGGGAGTTGVQNQGTDNLRQLREAYEGIKKEFEPWQKLNLKPEQVTQYSGIYQKVYGEVGALGRELGYSDEEIAEALNENPVATLDFLRNQAAEAEQNRQQPDGRELNELINQGIEKAIGPIQQRENLRMTNEANALFERTVHSAAVEAFKAEGIDVANIPQDELFMLTSATSEILKYDEGALRSLKYEGKTASIQKAFQEAKGYLDKYYLARAGRDRARVQPPSNRNANGQFQSQQPGRKPTLDEMIENPGVINQKYSS